MKHPLTYLLCPLALGIMFFGCSDQPAPSSVTDEAHSPLSKTGSIEYTDPYSLDNETPFIACDGDLMQYHGWVLIHFRELTTPSGNLITNAWVDYKYDQITLENTVTGEIWTNLNGHNPFGEVIKDNGFYVLHYQWNELYKNDAGDLLHIHLKGYFKIDNDGMVTHARESFSCHRSPGNV